MRVRYNISRKEVREIVAAHIAEVESVKVNPRDVCVFNDGSAAVTAMIPIEGTSSAE